MNRKRQSLRFFVRHVAFVASVAAWNGSAYAGLSFASDFDDSAVKYVIKDAARMVKGFDGTISLKKDPSMEYRQWRLVSDGGDKLTVYGADEQGVIYGVYTLLEKHMGCRWYAPDTEKAVTLKNWRFPKLDERGKCAFFHFHVGDKEGVDPAWLLRNKQTENAAYSVGVHQGSPRGTHTFPDYAAEIKKLHPEMFGVKPAAAKGKKCESLCLTDPKMRECVAEQMIRYIEKDRARRKPGAPHYSLADVYDLAQADGVGGEQCMCENCKAMMEREGSYSGPNIDFCNAVAAIVNRKYPEIKVRTLAYSYVVDPPKTVVANDNVIVRFCKAHVFKPLLPGSEYAPNFLKWRKHAKKLGVWSYWRTYDGQMYPHVKPRADIEAELRFCADNGVWSYYAEQEEPTQRSFAMLQHWIFLKMCENPYQPVKKLSDEFMSAYYGKAAPAMDAYLTYLESRQCRDRTYLDREFFEKANAWLDEAESLAKGDARSLLHIRWERVVVDRSMYDNLAGLQKAGFKYDSAAVPKRFAENAVAVVEAWAHKNPGYSKARLEEQRKALLQESKLYSYYPIPLPEIFKGLEVETLEWNQLPAVLGKVEYVQDPDAAAGTAFTPVDSPLDLPYEIGFYHGPRKEGDSLALYEEDIPTDEKFHPYRLGRGVILTSLYIYFHKSWHPRTYLRTLGIIPEERDIWLSAKFAGPAFSPGSTNANAVLFDRVFLVKNKITQGYEPTDSAKSLVKDVSSGEVSGRTKLWDMACLGTTDDLRDDLLVRGRVAYKNVEIGAFPQVGIRCVDARGRTAFWVSCATIYPGNEDGKNIETIITHDRIANRVRRRVGKNKPPYKLFFSVLVPEDRPGTSVSVSELEVKPVKKGR